jgi:pimeloyl-ACP methyl ester carboxylesterase
MYGQPPYNVAVIHGGPGAAGELALVAIELSELCGVLEPMQTSNSIDGQIEELKQILELHCRLPVILVGHSWGAWLSYIFASRYPGFVKKLILVGSAPFQAEYATQIMETRYQRLSVAERSKLQELMKQVSESAEQHKDGVMTQIGKLISKADSYSPLTLDNEEDIMVRYDVFQKVWEEASALRRTGGLLSFGKEIHCPVVAIHGDYDSHPCEGVQKPLANVVSDFKFILLPKCGHRPWTEVFARESFFYFLAQEVSE